MEFELSEIYSEIKNCNDETPRKIQELIKNDEDIHLKNENGGTFLHYIAEHIHAPFLIPVVFQLSNAGIDKNIQDSNGNTALHIAAEKYGVFQLVRALITVGVDPNIVNRDGNTARDVVTDPLVKLVIRNLSPGLWKAIEDGDDDLIMRLIGSWCKIDDKRKGKSLIDMASLLCGSQTVTLLEADRATNDLVHYALARDKKKMKKVLKRPGVDVNTRNITYIDHQGETIPIPLLCELSLLLLERPVKILLEHGADVNLFVDDAALSPDPLYLYLMKHLPGIDAAYDILEMILETADLSLVSNPAGMFALAFDKEFPATIVKLLQTNGINIFDRDENGYTMRDRIYLEYFTSSEAELRNRLGFVDEIVIKFACEGDVEFLEQLALNSYDCENVTNRQGKSLEDILVEKGVQRSITFVANLPRLQKSIRRLHQSVANGNLKEVKELMNGSLSSCRDKGGRSLLHKAVLFERRFIIKFLLLQYPETINVQDTNGKTPEDYKRIAPDILKLIEKERENEHGMDVYLLQKYMEFKNAILNEDQYRVEQIRNSLYVDVSLNDIHKNMYPVEPPQRDLLSLCIDDFQDGIAKYLLSQGLEWNRKYEDEVTGEKINVYDVAKHRDMKGVVEYIEFQH
ncbi:hypothetical protein KUTeg_009221 [Tegillarca granosa]|uniref:Uncharacterized protein n=1 Tax=Tegillarca granosa TaxID=220873 RepID=A0ABQ9F763_TEGGR|nr:hypothetical protein KUTeg_009221 [Tegillarca granosa]